MSVTREDGTPFWERGGRVKDLKLQVENDDSAKGALLRTAETLKKQAGKMRELSSDNQAAANEYLAKAKAKEEQAEELELAASKL